MTTDEYRRKRPVSDFQELADNPLTNYTRDKLLDSKNRNYTQKKATV